MITCKTRPLTRVIDLVPKIASGELSSFQCVSSYTKRAKEVNSSINAIVEWNENALNEARLLDEYLEREGKVKGPLHGIPCTIKEHISVKGMHATRGLVALKDVIAQEDAALVKKLKAAGAIVIGTTNMMESGLAFDTNNPIYGATKNPYDLNRSPGGSSGGEGAIIAAGGSPMGIGSDLGGSIRIPSHYCGIHGIKPTTGRISRNGSSIITNPILGFLPSFVCMGPMARYISDLEYILEVLSGPDSSDPYTYIPPFKSGSNSLPKKIAYFWDDGFKPKVDDSIKEAVCAAVDVLQKEGVETIKEFPEDLKKATDLMYRLSGYDNLEKLKIAKPSNNIITTFLQEMDKANLGISSKIELETLEDDITLFKQSMCEFFDEYDALVMPTAAFPALKPEQTFSKEYERGYFHFRYTYAWNIAEFPALTVGSVSQASIGEFAGLPVGVQIIVPPFKEDVAFSIGKLLEEKIESVSPMRPPLFFSQ